MTVTHIAKDRPLLVERRLLPEELLNQMMSVLPDDPPAAKSYGLGLIADPVECGAVWGHSGMGFGYRHWPFLRLETGRFAIFMMNGSYGFRVAAEAPADVPPDLSPAVRASVTADCRCGWRWVAQTQGV